MSISDYWRNFTSAKHNRTQEKLASLITQAVQILDISDQRAIQPLEDRTLDAIIFTVLRNKDATRTPEKLAEISKDVDKNAWDISTPIRPSELKGSTGRTIKKALQITRDKLGAMGKHPDGGKRLFSDDIERILAETQKTIGTGKGG